jgi:hypothetical protein
VSVLAEIGTDLHVATAEVLRIQSASKLPQPFDPPRTLKVAYRDLKGSEAYALGKSLTSRLRAYYADLNEDGERPVTEKQSLWNVLSVSEYPPEIAGVLIEAEAVS